MRRGLKTLDHRKKRDSFSAPAYSAQLPSPRPCILRVPIVEKEASFSNDNLYNLLMDGIAAQQRAHLCPLDGRQRYIVRIQIDAGGSTL